MKSTLQIGPCAVVRANFLGAVHDGEELSLIEESTGYYEVPCNAPGFGEVAKTGGLLAAGNGLVDPSRVRIVYQREELVHVTFETRHSATLECGSEDDARKVLAKLLAAMDRLGPRYTEIAHLARTKTYLGGRLYVVTRVSIGDGRGRRSEAAVEPEGIYFTREEAEAWVESYDGSRHEMVDGEESATFFNILEVRAEGVLSELVNRMTIEPASDGVPF